MRVSVAETWRRNAGRTSLSGRMSFWRSRSSGGEEVGGLGASWREESYLGSMSAKRSPVKPHTPVLHFTGSSGHASSERFVWGKKKGGAY